MLTNALWKAQNTADSFLMLMTTPTLVEDRGTSTTELWRESLFHASFATIWNWNATAKEVHARFKAADEAISDLRAITPDGVYIVSV